MIIFEGFLLLILGGWGGVMYLAINNIPFWVTYLILIGWGTLSMLFLYYGIGWMVEKLLQRAQKNLVFQRLNRTANFIQNVSPAYHFRKWLQKRKEWLVFTFSFLPCIPIIPETAIVVARLFKLRHAIVILFLGMLFRSFILCYLVYSHIV